MHVPSTIYREFSHAVAAACIAAFVGGAAVPAHAASGSVKCDSGKTYTASVPGGSCRTGANWVKCTGSSGDTANIDCNRTPGPCESSGSGACKSELKMGEGSDDTSVRDGLKRPRKMMTEQPMMKSD